MGKEPRERRNLSRGHMLLAATIEVEGCVSHVRLRDLSCAGGMIETEAELPLNQKLLFRRDDIVREATVLWARDGHVGLVFAKPLADQEVRKLTRRTPAARKSIRRPIDGSG